MPITDEQLAKIAEEGLLAHEQAKEMAAEILVARKHIAELERQRSTPIRLPYCSASPVCEIEAGYASGVSDCKEAIRRAGFPIDGEDA